MANFRRLRVLLAAILIAPTGIACKTTMTSVVKGSRSPRTIECGIGEAVQIENGGFTIYQKCVSTENLIVGDGRSEVTEWDFDLSRSKYIEELEAGCPIESVWIELELLRTRSAPDSLSVRGSWQLGLEEIQNVEPGSVETVQINVLQRAGRPSPYTPQVVRNLILAEPVGHLPMQYEFDGRVSYAKLWVVCR
jgi:hypothetical protein